MRAFVLFSLAAAAVARPRVWSRNDATPVPLTSAEIQAFDPYLYYAAAVYCDSADLAKWDCGANCDKNAQNFAITAAGGNGADVQNWYVGYDNALDTVISVHQGTDLTHIQAIATDTKLLLKTLPQDLYPGAPTDAKAHLGFIDEHAKTADAVLAAIETTLAAYNTTRVSFVGHSLGAGLALLEALSASSRLAARDHVLTYKTVLFGLSRTGNQAFADWADATLGSDVAFVQNRNDLVPIVPGRSLGYVQISGEVHIEDDGTWNRCPGQDNTHSGCAIAAAPTIFSADFFGRHFGPYDGINLGFCWMNSS